MRWNHKDYPDMQVYKIWGKSEWVLKTSEFYAENVCEVYMGMTDKPIPLKTEFGESTATENFIVYECIPWNQKRLKKEQPEWERLFDEFIKKNILKNG